MSMPNNTPVRFDLLDGLRGIAAIAVMVDHFTSHNELDWIAGAWVAVDLFFIFSGFVIAHSYGARLLAGMSFKRFLLTRLIRLTPLYLIALLIGLLAAVLSLAHGNLNGIRGSEVAVAALLGAMWLPYFNSLGWPFGDVTLTGIVFPLNDPSWSLFFELVVNVVFFWYVTTFRKLSSPRLVIASALLFALCIVGFRAINPGWGTGNFVFGFPRVLAEFFAGALIYQVGCHLKTVTKRLAALVIGVSLSGFFIDNEKFALINSLALIPLTLILASAIRVGETTRRACKFLGDLSYPLCVLHFPIYRLMWVMTDVKSLSPLVQTVVIGATSLAVALLFIRIDRLIRRNLMARLTGSIRPAQSMVNPGIR